MINKADAEKDIDLFDTACSLAFLQEQISNALKMTIIIARRNQRDNGFMEKFTRAIEEDAKEIELEPEEKVELPCVYVQNKFGYCKLIDPSSFEKNKDQDR